MALLNVRLSKADEEAVRILKRSRVEISAVVRAALHREADKHRERTPAQVSELVEQLFADFPEPADVPERDYDVHDRRAFAEAMRVHLARKRTTSRRRR